MQAGTAIETHLQTNSRGIQGREEVGGWTRVTKRRAFLRGTCQSRGAEVGGGGWTNRNGLRGGICRLHVDLRRRNLGTTASFRNWLDLVSSHAMIKVLGGLSSSNEQGGHTYFCVFFLPWPVAGLCFAGNSAWRREEACRRRCGTRSGEVAQISGRWSVGAFSGGRARKGSRAAKSGRLCPCMHQLQLDICRDGGRVGIARTRRLCRAAHARDGS